MLKLYPENYDVSVDVLFTDLNGDLITVTGVSAALYDGDDEQVVDFGSLPFDFTEGKKTVVIPASFNVLEVDELSTTRILRVVLSTLAGDVHRSFGYIIEGETRLEILNNTFVTLEAAEALLRDMPSLKAYQAASDDQKAAALINAYTRIARVQVRFEQEPPIGTSCRREVTIRPGGWSEITKDEFLGYPKSFRKALRLAQLNEANVILTDSPIAARQRDGIISETVGESSVMLKTSKLDLGVDRSTLQFLSGYVYYTIRLGRA
jgi:hypothetical protein